MAFMTTEELRSERTHLANSIRVLKMRINQMDAVTRKRAENTIANLRQHISDIDDDLAMAGAA